MVDEAFDELDDVGHALGRAGEVVDLVDSQSREIAVVIGDILLGHLEHRDATLIGLLNELVIDVSDVHHPVDFVATIREIPLNAVEDHRPDHVTNVSLVVNRRPAQIDSHFTRPHGDEGFLLPRERVVDA